MPVLLWFPYVSGVKAWIFKCSQREGDFGVILLIINGISVWILDQITFHRFINCRYWKTYGQPYSGKFRVTGNVTVWMLENPNFHTGNGWYWGEKGLCVNGWILFPGNKLRIYAREEQVHHRCREVVFTTPGLVKTTPGLVKTTPGLVKTTPGLVKTFWNGVYDVSVIEVLG